MRRFIADLKARLRPLDNVYLRSLRDGALNRDDFIETQVQFLFAVVFFFEAPAAAFPAGLDFFATVFFAPPPAVGRFFIPAFFAMDPPSRSGSHTTIPLNPAKSGRIRDMR